MIELFKAGDEVPREWFTRLDNVESIMFLHPCVVETTDTQRTIRKAEPILDNATMIFFSHVKDSNGEMNVQFDRETYIYLNYLNTGEK